MADFEIKGGAGPYEAAAIVAVFNRLMAEAAASLAGRPPRPRPSAWVRAYQSANPEDPLPVVLLDQTGPRPR